MKRPAVERLRSPNLWFTQIGKDVVLRGSCTTISLALGPSLTRFSLCERITRRRKRLMRKWGWRKLGKPQFLDSPTFDVLILNLP